MLTAHRPSATRNVLPTCESYLSTRNLAFLPCAPRRVEGARRCSVAPRRFLSAALRLSAFDNFRTEHEIRPSHAGCSRLPPPHGALGLIVRNKEKNDGVPTFPRSLASSRCSTLVRSRRTKGSNERTNVYMLPGKSLPLALRSRCLSALMHARWTTSSCH